MSLSLVQKEGDVPAGMHSQDLDIQSILRRNKLSSFQNPSAMCFGIVSKKKNCMNSQQVKTSVTASLYML